MVAVVAPGLGDTIQAMKAGLLEVAGISSSRTKATMSAPTAPMQDLHEQCRTVLRTVALTGEGIAELIAVIAEYRRLRDPMGRGGAGRPDDSCKAEQHVRDGRSSGARSSRNAVTGSAA